MRWSFLAFATKTWWPHSSSRRLTHGEWVPTSMAMRSGCSESNRRRMASGVVRSLPSSMTSPLSVSIRHRWPYLSPRSRPAVIFAAPLLPLFSWADPPSIEPFRARTYLQTLAQGTARGIGLLIPSKVEHWALRRKRLRLGRRTLAVSARSPQDPAPEHEASFLLPSFWLSEPRPLPVRVPHPCRS